MSIETVVHYKIHCDSCKSELNFERWGSSYTWGEVVAHLRDCGWRSDMAGQFCGRCTGERDAPTGM